MGAAMFVALSGSFHSRADSSGPGGFNGSAERRDNDSDHHRHDGGNDHDGDHHGDHDGGRFDGKDGSPNSSPPSSPPAPPVSAPPTPPGVSAPVQSPTSPSSAPSVPYTIQIRGHLCGTGTASVNGNSVTFTATVKNDAGISGSFTASGTVINSRFQGTGTGIDQAITLSGRIDPADPVVKGKSVIRLARIQSTFALPNGTFGRIFGVCQLGSPSSGSGGSNH